MQNLSITRCIHIRAEWDSEASVWIASSDKVAGLATEADSIEELEAKLKTMVPELLEANGIYGSGLLTIEKSELKRTDSSS